jgi:hypothetical protein
MSLDLVLNGESFEKKLRFSALAKGEVPLLVQLLAEEKLLDMEFPFWTGGQTGEAAGVAEK